MTDSLTLPAAGILLPESVPAPFFVVSRRKFAVMFLATLGLYVIYWYYKNWDRYKGVHPEASQFGTTVWPVPRAAFALFFTHALFRKIRTHGRNQPAVARWHNDVDATAVVALMILQNVIDIPIGGLLGDLASAALMLPMLFFFLKAQAMINLVCGDPEGSGNDRFSKANRAWIVVGVVCWLIVVAGFFV